MEKLIDLYKQWAGEEPIDVIKLAGQGSNRQYFRIIKQDGDTVIGVIGTSRDDAEILAVASLPSQSDDFDRFLTSPLLIKINQLFHPYSIYDVFCHHLFSVQSCHR